MKRFVFRLAALCLGLSLTLILLEAALRIVGGPAPPPPPSAAVREVVGGAGHLPHHRPDPELKPTAKPFRIVGLGDSFTWGAGVFHADTYPQRLEVLLERISDGDLDVQLEMRARPGWNTSQEVEALEDGPPTEKPDLLLLGYCLNDAELPRRKGNDDLEDPLPRREPTGVSAFFYGKSRIYRRLRDRLESARQRRAFSRYYHGIYERVGWENTRQALDDLQSFAAQENIPVVGLIFPIFDQQLGPGYPYADLHGLVATELEKRDFRVIDLLPAYQGIDARRLAVEPFTDPHPNELAHRIASQVLAKYLLEENLVPIDGEKIFWKSIDLTPTQERETRP